MPHSEERDGETYIDKHDAFEMLEISSHQEVARLLEGLFGKGLGVRLNMVKQLEEERVLGRLSRRGANFASQTCDCSENAVWCSNDDRVEFLNKVINSLAPDPDDEIGFPENVADLARRPKKVFSLEALSTTIENEFPNSCLTNQYCLELTCVRALLRGKIAYLGNYVFETATLGHGIPSIVKNGTAAERAQRDALLSHFRPHVNNYREETISDYLI